MVKMAHMVAEIPEGEMTKERIDRIVHDVRGNPATRLTGARLEELE